MRNNLYLIRISGVKNKTITGSFTQVYLGKSLQDWGWFYPEGNKFQDSFSILECSWSYVWTGIFVIKPLINIYHLWHCFVGKGDSRITINEVEKSRALAQLMTERAWDYIERTLTCSLNLGNWWQLKPLCYDLYTLNHAQVFVDICDPKNSDPALDSKKNSGCFVVVSIQKQKEDILVFKRRRQLESLLSSYLLPKFQAGELCTIWHKNSFSWTRSGPAHILQD